MENPAKSFCYPVLLVWIIWVCVLTACGQAKLTTPTLTPTGSTATSTPTPIRTILFTYTPQTTHMPIPADVIPQLTLDAAMTMTPFPIICELIEPWEPLPDGLWSIKACSKETEIYPDYPQLDYLQVVNNSDGRQWQVESDPRKPGRSATLWPVHWTKDGKYLFVLNRIYPDGPMTEFWDGSALLRLSFATGETDEILPDGFYAYAFSTHDRLAYISRGYQPPQFLNILDLNTGDEQRFSLGSTYCAIGHLVWSPQDERIIYTAATCAEYPYIASMYSYMIMDLNTGDFYTFYSSANALPRPLKWEHDYPMFMSARSSPVETPQCWVLNLDVGGLLPAPCP